MVSASLAAATRSVALAVVPILIWTIGLSDIAVTMAPWLSKALDQILKSIYFGSGATISVVDMVMAALQVAAVLAVGITVYVRRDAQ